MYGYEMRGKVTLKRKFLAGLFSALFLFCLFSGQQDAFANGDIQPLVETGWLADHLNKSGLAIVYVGGPASKKENWAFTTLVQWRLLDFLTQTEHLPDFGFYWIGEINVANIKCLE